MDRDIIDKTGIAGRFDIHLDLSMEDLMPGRRATNSGTSDPAGAAIAGDPSGTIFTAVRKLGLRLESSKGQREFIVIDHVERPTDN